MQLKTFISILLMFFFICSPACAAAPKAHDVELARILASARSINNPGDRIVALSAHFLDRPYAANCLVGGPDEPEQLVIDLSGFDCFTLLDVVEALRRAADVEDFPEQLKHVRYRDGEVTYVLRRHFFSDWPAADDAAIVDVTSAVGQGGAVTVVKQLNRRSDGALWLPGIDVTRRPVTFLPTSAITPQTLLSLQSGDYVGIYSDLDGLDVSHTGLIVKAGKSVRLRHASSRRGVERVVDEPLLDYLQGKPGLVVYRVKP